MSYQMLLHRDGEAWRVVFTGEFIGNMEGYMYRLRSSNQADVEE